MSDLPFAPFNPEFKPPASETPAPKPPRTRRPRQAAPRVPRQKRQKREKVAKVIKAPKFDLMTALQIGTVLTDLGEQTCFMKLHADLLALPKRAAKRIVGALAIVFA